MLQNLVQVSGKVLFVLREEEGLHSNQFTRGLILPLIVFYRCFFPISYQVGFVSSLSKACHSPVKICSIYSVDKPIYQAITKSCSMKVSPTLNPIPIHLHFCQPTQKKKKAMRGKTNISLTHTLFPL